MVGETKESVFKTGPDMQRSYTQIKRTKCTKRTKHTKHTKRTKHTKHTSTHQHTHTPV